MAILEELVDRHQQQCPVIKPVCHVMLAPQGAGGVAAERAASLSRFKCVPLCIGNCYAQERVAKGSVRC
jgi:hypothetical protein